MSTEQVSVTSTELRARALRVIPGGVHSPVRAFRSVGGDPVFFRRGAGARLFDVDGPLLHRFLSELRTADSRSRRSVTSRRAVHAAVDDGWSYGACEPYSLDLAEWIANRLPWVERIRFVSSGTEAVMSALRVARAATGRSAILKFEGCYHGHTDSMLVEAGSGLAGRVAASSAGIPDGILGDTIVASLDDDHAVDRAFEQHGSRIAAVIVEPLPANYGLLPQREAWLRRVAERARSRGALVILRRGHQRISCRMRRHGRSPRSAPGSRHVRQGDRRRVSGGRVRRAGGPDGSRRTRGSRLPGGHAQRESSRHARRSGDVDQDGASRWMARA